MITILTFKWNPLPNQVESIPTQIGNNKVIYGANHVMTHYNMISRNLDMDFRYVLITDEKIDLPDNIKQVDLWDDYRILGGCYHRLFTFSKSFGDVIENDRFVAMDLDMVITGNITSLLKRKEDFIYYRMHDSNTTFMNNSMYMMNVGARDFVWTEFDKNSEKLIAKRQRPGTDQAITNMLLDLDKEQYWDQGDMIFDMRRNILSSQSTELPTNCKIVMWPGPRDPNQNKWKNKYVWIKEYYR